VVCSIEVDPRWAQAQPGVDTCSHLIVLYWMDRARRDLAVQVPKQYGDGKPTFSLRSPVRPNPIALAVVELRKVEGNTLHVVGVDCLDNTPLLDIKPYFSSTDAITDARVGWHADRKR
jgi:tRNA-Thr(GGU) m(6)t(6)A37 methyltransferase TsaA